MATTFALIVGPLVVAGIVAGILLLDTPDVAIPILVAAGAATIAGVVWLVSIRRRF